MTDEATERERLAREMYERVHTGHQGEQDGLIDLDLSQEWGAGEELPPALPSVPASGRVEEPAAMSPKRREDLGAMLDRLTAASPSVTHEGRRHRMSSIESWLTERSEMGEQERAELDRDVAEGVILDPSGVPMPEDAQRRMRQRLLGVYGGLNHWEKGAEVDAEVRYLIPGLWQFGTIPLLGGNQKAGKSTLVTTELVPALVLPGRRFLGQFEPATLTKEERDRGVVVFNAEVLPAAYEEHLRSWGWDPDSDAKVVHLETEEGGPQSLDLSEPGAVEQWFDRLTYCECCDETDNWTPVVVIVDGVTAILHAAGKDTGWYGKWYAGFRKLLRLLDTPNGLAVGHSTLSGSHMMGGIEAVAGADGLWYYANVDADNAAAERRFWVIPRMGPATPRTAVSWNPEAWRLTMGVPTAPRQATALTTAMPSAGTAPESDHEQGLRALFEEHEGPSGWVPASLLREKLGRLDRAFAGLLAEDGGPIVSNGQRGPQSAYRWTEDAAAPVPGPVPDQ